MTRLVATATGLVALLLGADSALGYVRSRTQDSCLPVYWKQSCVFIQPDGNYVSDVAGPEVERIVQKSIASWMTRAGNSFLKLNYLPAAGAKELTYKDHLSVIIFRTGSKFCRPATAGAMQVCYDASAAAVTTVSYINKKGDLSDGLIVDADIEMNAVNNQFVEIGKPLPPADGRNQTDLENTLTHELGHLLGLDHTCRLSADPTCMVDHQNQPRQTCDTIERQRLLIPAYQELYQTTMFAIAPPKDIEKRTPKADDIAGIGAVSPIANDPKICEEPQTTDSSGCKCELGSAGHTPSGTPLGTMVGLGAALLALLGRRRLRLRNLSQY